MRDAAAGSAAAAPSSTPPDGRQLAAGSSSRPAESGASQPTGPDGGAATGGGGNGGSDSGGGSGSSGASTTTGGSTTTGSATTGGGGAPSPAPVCHSIGGGKHNCEVWRTAKPYSHSGSETGVLNAGTNCFPCQADLGRRETYGRWTTVWWARTDDDSGSTDVCVGVVHIKGGDNDHPVPGFRVC
ncbi:hypothetical protein [Streptomyces sp. NPDC001970]